VVAGFGEERCAAALTRGDGGGVWTTAVMHATSDCGRWRGARTATVAHAASNRGRWRGTQTVTTSDTGRLQT
jgi:hypothetical protein